LQAIFRQRRVRVPDALTLSAAEIRAISHARIGSSPQPCHAQVLSANSLELRHTMGGKAPRLRASSIS
jgi:hypothetical protein